MSPQGPTNEQIAQELDRIADLLETRDGNPHRIRAYRNGADRARRTDRDLAEAVRGEDGQALQDLPDIGETLARLISEYVRTGKTQLRLQLEEDASPEDVFVQVPGIGRKLAKRVAGELDVDSLEALEQAAHDGRLAQVDGFGRRRVAAVKMALGGMLSRSAGRRAQQRTSGRTETEDQPGVDVLLDVDREYRRKAEAGELRRIAPRRFNPEGEAWLPIMHTRRGPWSFTALYSNTARAHELGKTDDWVALYYARDGEEDQATVVTETRGSLSGERVVRGREADCERHYAASEG